MKRNERKEKIIFSKKKNVSRPSNPPDELTQNVSKKNPRRTNYSSIFSAKVQNLTVFSFIYMIRIRFFGPGELIQNGFRAAQYGFLLSSMSERVTVGFTGRWLQDIAFVFSLSTFPARRWTSDPEVILG